MNLIFPNAGLVEQLTRILNAGVYYHLFDSNTVVSAATVLGDFTEASFAGYAVVPLSFSDFTLNGVSGNSGFAIAAPISFLNSSGGDVNVYGYFVTNPGGGILLAAARFDGAPITILNTRTLTVVPTWGDFSELVT